MNGRGLSGALLAATFLVAGTASVSTAQSPSPTCSFFSSDEVAAAMGLSQAPLSQAADGLYCVFGGSEGLFAILEPGADLATMKADHREVTDLTVADRPALWDAPSAQLSVDAGGRLLELRTTPGGEVDPLPGLSALAALALPRLPAPPDADAEARIRSFIPTQLGGTTLKVRIYPGSTILGLLAQDHPEATTAITDVLATSGTAPDDLVVALAGDPASGTTLLEVILVPGGDARALLDVVLSLAGNESGAKVVKLGGKAVRVIGEDPAQYAYANGDLAVIATDPGVPLDDFFGSLP